MRKILIYFLGRFQYTWVMSHPALPTSHPQFGRNCSGSEPDTCPTFVFFVETPHRTANPQPALHSEKHTMEHE